jgi:hypothetical protein
VQSGARAEALRGLTQRCSCQAEVSRVSWIHSSTSAQLPDRSCAAYTTSPSQPSPVGARRHSINSSGRLVAAPSAGFATQQCRAGQSPSPRAGERPTRSKMLRWRSRLASMPSATPPCFQTYRTYVRHKMDGDLATGIPPVGDAAATTAIEPALCRRRTAARRVVPRGRPGCTLGARTVQQAPVLDDTT